MVRKRSSTCSFRATVRKSFSGSVSGGIMRRSVSPTASG